MLFKCLASAETQIFVIYTWFSSLFKILLLFRHNILLFQCQASVGTKAFFRILQKNMSCVALLGAACTSVDEPLAKAAYQFHYVQVCFVLNTGIVCVMNTYKYFWHVVKVPFEGTINIFCSLLPRRYKISVLQLRMFFYSILYYCFRLFSMTPGFCEFQSKCDIISWCI